MATTPSVIPREAGTSTPAVRSGKRRPSLSHVVIGIAAVLAFGLNLMALQGRQATTPVAVATRQIPEGTPFAADMVRFDPVPADFGPLPQLVTETDLGELDGWIVSRSVTAGGLLDRAWLIPPGAGGGSRTMSIPVPVEHAAGGNLVAGDRVDVISVVDGSPEFIATDLAVIQIAAPDIGGLSGTTQFHIVVGVSPEQALALAGAISEGSIEILRSTGASASEAEDR